MPSLRQTLLEHAVGLCLSSSIEKRQLAMAVLRTRSHESEGWSELHAALTFSRAGFVRDTVIAAESEIEFLEMISLVKLHVGPFRLGFRLIVMADGVNWSTGPAGQIND